MFELKPLTDEGLPRALEKALRYRLLGEPEAAESICRDILRVAPDHEQALITLILALSDQLADRLMGPFNQARELLERLGDDYQRAYYTGILYERRAKAHMSRPGLGSGQIAYDWFVKAMASYEEAEAQRPAGNDESILRWNTCARIIRRSRDVKPQEEDAFMPLLE